MSKPKLQELAEFGQSVWLDYISRPMIESGQLSKRIEEGLRGMTSNPAIFNQAIGSSNDYDQAIVQLKGEHKNTFEIYDALTIKDIQDAADCFKVVYDATGGLDGYVSLEINPLLAETIEEQTAEGIRLHEKVQRENVMIKVPSTNEGFVVIEDLIAKGINVNATLIFSLEQYTHVAYAYIRGLKRFKESGGDVTKVRSVASVFVSRVDGAIDQQIDELLANENDAIKTNELSGLKGQAAVANCRVIFEKYKELFSDTDFKTLADQGAHVQRVLWASTSTKNPEYNDVKYVEELITHPTVNTIPEKTLNAFIDHGKIKEAFDYDAKQSQCALDTLKGHGIDINHICADLLHDGCIAFNDAFNALLATVEKKTAELQVKS